VDVYLLWHMRPLEGQEDLHPEMDYIETDDKLCGVFSSEEEAERARGQLTTQPGFRDYPNDFLVSAYELGKITCAEGFVTVGVDDEEQPRMGRLERASETGERPTTEVISVERHSQGSASRRDATPGRADIAATRGGYTAPGAPTG
jgi:homoserine kinase type II